MKKQRFIPPYLAIEDYNGRPILYNRKGEYSVVMSINNPIQKYSSSPEAYYTYNEVIANLIKTLGQGYSIQKHDIFSRTSFSPKGNPDSYLSKKYFEYFTGRAYIEHRTYITITQEKGKGFLQFSERKWKDFHDRIEKTLDLLSSAGWNAEVLDKDKLGDLLVRYFSVNFRDKDFSLSHFQANENSLRFGEKFVRSTSLVNIDEMDMPSNLSSMCIQPQW